MTGPLVILAIGALAVGAYFHWTGDFIGPTDSSCQTPALAYWALQTDAATDGEGGFALARRPLISTVVAAGRDRAWPGCSISAGRGWPKRLTRVDEALGLMPSRTASSSSIQIYAGLIVRPLEAWPRLLAWIDRRVIDGLVNLSAPCRAPWARCFDRCRADWSSFMPWRWRWGC